MYKLKHIWNVSVLNPITAEEIMKSTHNTIDDIADKYKQINLNTWRNICMGRSKVYNKFIKVSKEERKLEDPRPPQDENKPVLPRRRRRNKESVVIQKEPEKLISNEEKNNNPIVLDFN